MEKVRKNLISQWHVTAKSVFEDKLQLPCSVYSLPSEILPSFASVTVYSPFVAARTKQNLFHLSIAVELYSGSFLILKLALSIFLISPLSCFFEGTYEKLLWERRWHAKPPTPQWVDHNHNKDGKSGELLLVAEGTATFVTGCRMPQLWQHCTVSIRHSIANLNTKTIREVALRTRKIAAYQHRNMRSRNL